MNKKNIIMTFLLGISVVGTSFSYDARAIRKDLEAKYAHNLINACQLAEDGMSLQEVLNRDIQIMEDHKQRLLQAIDEHKSFVERSVMSFLKKAGAVATGGLSVGSGLFVVRATNWLEQVWDGKTDPSIKVTDTLVKTGSFFGFLNDEDVRRYHGEKSNFLCDTVKGYEATLVLLPILAVTSIASGYFFIKMVRSAWNHHAELDAKIAKWQVRIDRDIIIIAQLKELKQAAAHQ